MFSRVIAAVALAALAASAAAGEPRPFRISVENLPSHFQARFARRFAEALAARAGPGLQVELFDSARLARDVDVLAAMSKGSVEMALPGIWQFDRTVPDAAVLMLPSVYGLPGPVVRAAADGALGAFLAGKIEAALPVKVVGRWLDVGHGQLFWREKSVGSAAEIAGKRIRVAGGRANAERIAALGGAIVSIPSSDLPAYLELGRIDGVLSTYETVASGGFAAHGLAAAYEDDGYYPFYVPIVAIEAWEGLSAEERSAVAGLWEELVDEGRADSERAQAAAKEQLARGGMIIVVPGAAERGRTRASLLAEEAAMAHRLGVSDEALVALRGAFGPGRP